MDLLFKRYASPFSLLDGYIQTCRFSEFIDELISIVNKETEEKELWDFYLHRWYIEKSFPEFVEDIKNKQKHMNMTTSDKEEILNLSMDILRQADPGMEVTSINGLV